VQEKALALLGKRGYATRNGGTKGAPFHVLIGSSMPGVLVEVGYCSNINEAKRLAQAKYLDALAEGIGNGIHYYAQQLELAAK
jgi:N-acetylmuramoyl-L-alanine amidase